MANITDQQLLIAINSLALFGRIKLSDITQLSGGQCNVNVLVGQGNQKFVVRFLASSVIANPIDRSREFSHQCLAASHLLAPMPVAYYSIDQLLESNTVAWSTLSSQFSAVVVAHYCVGEPLARYADKPFASMTSDVQSTLTGSLASLLSTLHQIPYQPKDEIREQVTPFARLSQYWQLYCQKNPKSIELHRAVIGQILDDATNITLRQRCFIHGDVNPGNIIVNQQQVRLIDWEYSAYDDPYIDLASTIIELEMDATMRDDFLSHYSLQCQEVSEQRLALFESYYCAICWLWSQLHSSQSDNSATLQAITTRNGYYYQRLLRNIRSTK